MEYGDGFKVVRQTFVDVLLVEGEDEAVEACGRMADFLGMDAETVRQSVAADWQAYRRRFVEAL